MRCPSNIHQKWCTGRPNPLPHKRSKRPERNWSSRQSNPPRLRSPGRPMSSPMKTNRPNPRSHCGCWPLFRVGIRRPGCLDCGRVPSSIPQSQYRAHQKCWRRGCSEGGTTSQGSFRLPRGLLPNLLRLPKFPNPLVHRAARQFVSGNRRLPH